MSLPVSRYSKIAILLHWLTAVAILSMIPMGLWMTAAIERPDSQALAYRIFQIHKSLGFLILALTVFRICWRLTHRPPDAPPGSKSWETFAAGATHAAFYGLLLALPITGWLYVSSGWSVGQDRALEVATSWFGLFGVPHIPGIAEFSIAIRRALAFQTMGAHSMMAWGTVALIFLHVGAALKHHFLDRDDVLARMTPLSPLSRSGHQHGSATGASAEHRHWPEILAGIFVVVGLGSVGAIAASPAPKAEPQPIKIAAGSALAEVPVAPGTARAWTIDDGSSIAFGGTHAGRPFKGRFDQWQGQVWFDPADLAGSKAIITVRTDSALTGDATQEGSLKGAEWLDPTDFPTARFVTTEFRALSGDHFEATGTLTLKQISIPVVLPFTFHETNGVARVEGWLKVDRTTLDLGMVSDAGADWVSREISIEISVAAHATP